ncbi:MFS transporter [Streptomyces sp. NPDC049915]|uniref:MFS transporter n=1 Tax=Streptomyces sp. NPDC049915 TaxID=3155510 RepID=UPI00342FC499
MPTVTPRAPAPRPLPAVRIRTARPVAPFALNASLLATLLAGSSAPTPLYPHNQDAWHLSELTVTVVFSAYSLTLLPAPLTTGALSDHLGRRPVLVGALALEAVSMVLPASADGTRARIAARVVQGAATGAATSAAGAALLDLADPRRPERSALANSIAPVAAWPPASWSPPSSSVSPPPRPSPSTPCWQSSSQPRRVTFTLEKVRPRLGVLRSLYPHLAVPPPARRALLAGGSSVIAVWALAASTPPSGRRSCAWWPPAPRRKPAACSSSRSPPPPRRRTAPRAVAAGGSLAVLPAGALTLSAMHGAGLPAYYVLSYLSMSLPAIAAGAATGHYGLRTTAHAVAAALVAVTALAALGVSRSSPAHRPPDGTPHTGTTRSGAPRNDLP